MPHPLRYALFALTVLNLPAYTAVVEDFDGGWVDGSYAGLSTYDHVGVGIWESSNCLIETTKTRSGGGAVRFQQSNSPSLELQGLDGNGIDGGVGTVTFWHRHWDGDGSTISFALEYSVDNGTNWITAGTGSTDATAYQQFSSVLELPGDNILLRIVTTSSTERLIVDDFEATDLGGGSNPTISFVNPTSANSEADGTIFIPVQVSPAGPATVNVSATGGDATSGSDYTLVTTSLTFTAGSPTQQVEIALQNNALLEPTETLELTLAGATGGTISSGTHTLTITDDDQPPGGGSGILTIMAANTTSGTQQKYEAPGERIFQALDPDIVGIQEFNVPSGETRRQWVDRVFGTEFYFVVEPLGPMDSLPNGIISRYPITASGEWNDPQLNNRDFAWATVDIPGEIDLHVISVHLHSSGGSSSRNIEATEIVAQVNATFSPSDYIVLAGDFNTSNRNEAAINTLESIFSDASVPVDQSGDADTNSGRSSDYDWVMPNAALQAKNTTVTIEGTAFVNGVVFDTRVWSPPPSPSLTSDSGATNMQHMAVMKAYIIPVEPQFTSLGTPHAWLETYGITSNHDAADLLDPDGDGLLTWQEYISNTDPTDGTSVFEITSVGGETTISVSCETRPDRLYRIEFADGPATPGSPLTWSPFATVGPGEHNTTGGSGGSHSFLDDFGPTTTGAPPTGTTRLYRLGVLLP